MKVYAHLGSDGLWEYDVTTDNRVTFGDLSGIQAFELLKLTGTLAPHNELRHARRECINAHLSA